MKKFIKREWTGAFKKGIIEFDDTVISIALENGLEKMLDNQRSLAEYYKKDGQEKNLEDAEKEIHKLEQYLKAVEVKNEIPMGDYSIIEKKVDYHFREAIRVLSDDELLEKIRKLYPEDRFNILPHSFRDTVTNSFMVPGRNKDYLFTYEKSDEKTLKREEMRKSLEDQLLGKTMELYNMNKICIQTIGDDRLDLMDEKNNSFWRKRNHPQQGQYDYGLNQDETNALFSVEFNIVEESPEFSEIMVEVTKVKVI